MGQDLLQFLPGAGRAFGGRGQDQFSAQGAQHAAALDALDLGHDQQGLVTFEGGQRGHGHAGVAAGGFDQGVARP